MSVLVLRHWYGGDIYCEQCGKLVIDDISRKNIYLKCDCHFNSISYLSFQKKLYTEVIKYNPLSRLNDYINEKLSKMPQLQSEDYIKLHKFIRQYLQIEEALIKANGKISLNLLENCFDKIHLDFKDKIYTFRITWLF